MHDAIVIGSGIGGLAAAGLLSGVAGRRVLVLEKHTQPGGLTHVFRRDGASWDVGLHYVGEVAPGSPVRALFDYLSGGELRWRPLPADFDRFVYPDLQLAEPSDPAEYQRRLVERFPQEAGAIRRYFRDVRAAQRWMRLVFTRDMVPSPMAPLVGLVARLMRGAALETTGEYLGRRFRSPQLRALLASQWGDYGLPPSRSAFAIHGQIVAHYLDGAWFPEGGAARIARTFEKRIERAGGAILVGMDVQRILVEAGRAVGVVAIDRRGAVPREVTFRAPVVISNAGAVVTCGTLLPTDGVVGSAFEPLRALIDRLGPRLSAVTAYLRLKAPVTTIGVQGENYWINTDYDHDAVEAHAEGLLAGQPHRIYVSFPSVKAGDGRFHTAEIIAFVDEARFAAWRDCPKGDRGADYSALKQRIADGMLRLAETAIPGLSDLVTCAEVSTPLTMTHYTSHSQGGFYGLPATPERYRGVPPGARTPLPGLFLSGSDAGCLGIVGALMGGVSAACAALGSRGYPMIQRAVRGGPVPAGGRADLPEHKQYAVLRERVGLTPTVFRLGFELERGIEGFVPGQFARLHVGDDEWRDYSIAGSEGRQLSFLVSVRTGGDGSRFAGQAALGTRTEIEGPMGSYTLAETGHRSVFVATGTGIAPFLPMFAALGRAGTLERARLIFGARTRDEDLTGKVGPLPPDMIVCLSQDEAPAGGRQGRVTDVLAALDFDPGDTDFYVCGSAAMVADCRRMLEQRGARRILVEAF